jgi:DNA-binding MarR family transcriptional regulator
MPDADPNPNPLFQLFNEIGIIEQLSRAMIEARMPAGILTSQFAVLNHLVRVCDGRSPLELARAFQVPKTTMTHTLAVLEKLGFVRQAPNPADGRSKCIWLTAEGAAFRQTTIAALQPDFDILTRRIAVDDLTAMLPGLTRLRQTLDALRSQD